MAPLLDVAALQAGYRDTPILHGVSITVEPGEIVSVIGPNGAGKSTLLKAIIGLLRIFAGDIRFAGNRINGKAPEAHVGSGLGYVPQVANVFASLTVRENLYLCTRRGQDFAAATDKVLAMFPELRPKLPVNAGSLSGGERQMLAFARCLITEPRLLLLDEPTAALSPLLTKQIFGKITEIAARGTAILLVEQNALRALEISDRAYVLTAGRNAAEGRARDLIADPKIKELYLGGEATHASPPPPAADRPLRAASQ